MSIKSIGVDLCDVQRLDKIIKEHGERFVNRVYTGVEIAYCAKKFDGSAGYAARFAAKEALLKALGTGLREGITWKDMEVINDELGKPDFKFYGRIPSLIGNRRVLLSLAHTHEYAVAFVVIEE
jgi:holo-[acyl-carrier protein] synthase